MSDNITSVEVGSLKMTDSVISSVNLDNYAQTSQLSSYLALSGGQISGDIVLFKSNYIQTTDPANIGNFSQKNSFIQAEAVDKYGIAYAGTNGYCIIGVDSSNNKIQLSGDIELLNRICNGEITTGNVSDYILSNSIALKVPLGVKLDSNRLKIVNLSSARFSIALSNESSPSYYTLSSVDPSTGWVALKEPLSDYSIDKLSSVASSDLINMWENDDNAFYLAGFPEVGNAVIKNFYGQHVEGGSTRAIGKYSHAEGRDTIANMRYSHAEGTCTVADEMAAHAEGFGSVASGRHAHAEGYLTLGSGKYAHAEGSHTQATALATHAEGEWTKAKGDYSHAEGFDTQANAAYSHVAGIHANVRSDHLCAWCWSGISASTNYYTSNGSGTFNINPANGISGFYIGNESLDAVFSNKLQPVVDSMNEVSAKAEDITYNAIVSVMQQELVGDKLTEYTLNMPETMLKTGDLNRPLSFTAFKPGSTVSISKIGNPPERTFLYSTDMQNWNAYSIGETIQLDKLLDCVYFKVSEVPSGNLSSANYYAFQLTGKIKAGGNIMSLLQPEINQLASTTQINVTHAFIKLFAGQTALETMPLLPATELTNDCYDAMLSGCTNLTAVVDLPATTIPARAYQWMMKGCSSITNTPSAQIDTIGGQAIAFEMFRGCSKLSKCNIQINATTTTNNCFGSMFNGCSNLKNAPYLPATTLTPSCYASMFNSCININSISAAFAQWNTAGNATANWLNNVSASGNFYHNPDLDVTVDRGPSTIPAGWTTTVM